MSNSTETVSGQRNVMPAELGSKFVRWGLVQFLLGFLVGFVPLLHYFHGAVAGDVGPVFLKNMTLWWGCPAVLIEYVLKTGGLGMVVIGLCFVIFSRSGASAPVSRGQRVAPSVVPWRAHLCTRLRLCGLCRLQSHLAQLLLPTRADGEERVARGTDHRHSNLRDRVCICIWRHPTYYLESINVYE
jgi:hypothetical protein